MESLTTASTATNTIIHSTLSPLSTLHNKSLPRRLPITTSVSVSTLSSSSSPLHITDVNVSDLYDFGKISSLNLAKQVHAQMIKSHKKWRVKDEIVKELITCYLNLGDFESAVGVFFVGFERNFVFWRWFLEEFRSFGRDPNEIIDGFRDLYSKGVNFDDNKVFTLVLRICAILMRKWVGVELHGVLIKRGCDFDSYLKAALMNFYERCWGSEYAYRLFGEGGEKDVLLWNEVIVAALRREGPEKVLWLFREMQFSIVKADGFTIGKALQACALGGDVNVGRQIHGFVFRNGLDVEVTVCNALINMYSKNGRVELARKVFDAMENGNLSSWNSMISGYATLGHFDDAMRLLHMMGSYNVKPDVVTWGCLLSSHLQHGLYHQVPNILRDMLALNLKPNSSSLTPAIQAVTELNLIKLGKEIHCFVIRNGLDYDEYVQTTLLDMYLKTDELVKAVALFNLYKTRNVVAWNSLILGYSSKGLIDDASKMFHQMGEEGITPDLFTWNSLLHGYSLKGCMKDALSVIDRMKTAGVTPNVVSWTTLISGASQSGNFEDALHCFYKMLKKGISPNSATLSSLLQACAGMSWLQGGKAIHSWCIRNGFDKDILVATALINLYVKSGSLQSASDIFQRLSNKTIVTWNCMIMGFAVYNQGREGIRLFNQMCEMGLRPNGITFIALLSGCKNSSLLDEGWRYFDSMKPDYKIEPTIEHYTCMVDLLGKAGYLDEAYDFIQTMPFEADASLWGSLLQSCRVHNNLKLGEIAAENLFKLEPSNAANYVIMMHLYSESGRWHDVDRTREKMTAQGVKVQQGWSWIEINNKVHTFSEEETHPDTGTIYFELYQLISKMKKVGYVPDIKCVHQDINNDEKEKVLLTHTEKLAITYGLMKTKSSTPIRVIKNARMCSDCHTVAKFMSMIKSREIILKDGARFHHFREGKCSCEL